MTKFTLPCLSAFAFITILLLTGSGSLFAQSTNSSEGKSIRSTAYYSDPTISPDGKEIAFVSGGDIWTVPSEGGQARLLIARQGYDSRPLYSPDGQYIAFNSTLTGNGDIYTYQLNSGTLVRLTYDDANDELSAWSPDGKYLYFASSTHDISGMRDVYRIKASGGTPVTVADNRYITEFFAAPSPDGKKVAFNARGVGANQWWRNGHSHLDESEIWLVNTDKNQSYQQLTEGGARELWPMWSRDGSGIFYTSDRSGAQNLWFRSLKGEAKQLTKFSKGRVLWPTISVNGESIVFERDFKIWKYNIKADDAAEVKIKLVGSAIGNNIEHLKSVTQFRDLALSPDGKKIAFTSHGEVFVASSKDGGDAFRVTTTPERESGPLWTSNSNSLIYTSGRDGALHLYQYNFIGGTETRLTNAAQDDAAPLLSPDGKSISFIRNGQELHVMDLASKKDLIVAKGYLGRPPFASTGTVSWSPDSKWLAYASFGNKTFRNILVTPASGAGEPKQISFLANTFGGVVNWSQDGKYILFVTTQRTETSNVARVDLVPQTPFFREEQFQKMFVEQTTSPSSPVNPTGIRLKGDSTKTTAPDSTTKALAARKSGSGASATPATVPAKAPIVIETEGIRQRLNLLSLGIFVDYIEISKDGKQMLVVGGFGDQENIYTYSLDESSREPAVLKQVTTSPAPKSNAQFSGDGREIFYIEQGRIQSVSTDSRQAKPMAVLAEMDVDFSKEKIEVFNEAWRAQNQGFYDPKFHGVDWNQVHDQYEPLVAGASNGDELRRILNLMVGELNASHSGVAGPPAGAGFVTGKPGLRFDRKEYEENGRFKIDEVVYLGPSAIPGSIRRGDYLIAIDDKKLDANDNIDELLQNKIGRRIILSISASASGSNPKKVSVSAVNLATEKGLLYKQWVMQQREYVNKISNGRLGYVHMIDMSEQSLNQLYIDMDAENHSKEGVVIDVRNNSGGFVNPYALDVIARKNYLTMTGRGMPSAPARVQLGQRALDAPTVLVTNQHSLSDAEDFTEGYRALGLGKVVGEQTAGWIIFTSSIQLLDGSVVRLPFSRIDDHEGKNMELVPRKVDIAVTRQLGEGDEKDSQLDAAVKELLGNLRTKASEKK
jgi:tricorn protease